MDTVGIYNPAMAKVNEGTMDDEHEFTLKETGLHCIAKVRYIL